MENIVLILTRSCKPDWTTYNKAYDDIRNSGLNPNFMINIDQSIDFTKYPTITQNDIDCILEETVTTSTKTKEIASKDSICNDKIISSKTTETEKTTKTTVVKSILDIELKKTYKCSYEYYKCDLLNYSILKNLKTELVRFLVFI